MRRLFRRLICSVLGHEYTGAQYICHRTNILMHLHTLSGAVASCERCGHVWNDVCERCATTLLLGDTPRVVPESAKYLLQRPLPTSIPSSGTVVWK